jgi:peroxin-2
VLPLIDIRSLRRRIAQLYTTFNPNSLGALLPVPMQKLLSGRGDISTNSSVQVDMGPYHTLPIDQCAICAQAASFDVALLSSNAPIKSSSSDTKPALENDPEAAPPLYPLNTPYTASCGHAYCYICLSTAILRAADDDGIPWACLRCVKPIQWIERVEAPAQSIGSSSEFEWSGSEMEAGSSSVGSLDFTNSDIGSDQ